MKHFEDNQDCIGSGVIYNFNGFNRNKKSQQF